MFFNGADVPDNEFEPIPAGDWLMMCHGAEYKASKSGKGKFIKIDLTVVDESNVAGRKLSSIFNIEHINPKVQQIGKGQFKAFLKAIAARDSLQSEQQLKYLIGKQVIGRVALTKGSDGDDQNKVKKWISTAAAQEAQPQPAAQQYQGQSYFGNAPQAAQDYALQGRPEPKSNIDDIPF